MPTSQLPCCDCGCQGTNCYRGMPRGCSHPCCWCKDLIGLDTCDSEYQQKLNDCMASLHSSEDVFCNKTITVDISTAASTAAMTITRTFDDPCNASADTASVEVPWTTSYQVTNYGSMEDGTGTVNDAPAPAEGDGDAPFWSPCPESLPYACKHYQTTDGHTPCERHCETVYSHPGDSCWSNCPTTGFMWKPSYFTVEDVSTWPGDQNITGMVLAYQGAVSGGEGCMWKGTTTLSGTAQRIWLASNGGEETIIVDSETCDAGCDCTTQACDACCHCYECMGTFGDMDKENGCCGLGPLGGCVCQKPDGGCTFPYGYNGAAPYDQNVNRRYSDNGFAKYYIPVTYTLTYELFLRFGDATTEAGIPPANWYHRISLDYSYGAGRPTHPRTGEYIGDWAFGAGETWKAPGILQPTACPTDALYFQSAVPFTDNYLQCSTADCPGSDCDRYPARSSLSAWDRCEIADRSGAFNSPSQICANTCGSDGECSQWITDGGPKPTIYPFWWEHIDSYADPRDWSCYNLGGGNECTTCSMTHLNNGGYLNGQATLYKQEVAGALQCASKCPIPISWSQGGWNVTLNVS